jgi:hypothetical protein
MGRKSHISIAKSKLSKEVKGGKQLIVNGVLRAEKT